MSGQTSFQVHSCVDMNSQTAPVWPSGRDVVLSLCIPLFAGPACGLSRSWQHPFEFSRQRLFIFIIWLIPLSLVFNGFIIVPSKNLQDEKQYTWARTKVFLTFPFLPSFHLTVLTFFLHLPEASLSFYKISASIKQRLFLSLTCLIPVLHLPLLPPSTYKGNKTHRWICTSINIELQSGVVGKGVYGKSLLHKSLTWWHTLSTTVEKTI